MTQQDGISGDFILSEHLTTCLAPCDATVAFRIEEQLKTMGLHFGMDLIHMSDKDFDDLVHSLQKMSELS